jgi:hypothetical protein
LLRLHGIAKETRLFRLKTLRPDPTGRSVSVDRANFRMLQMKKVQ